MMRCDECAHWETRDDYWGWEAKLVGMGRCKAVIERWRVMDEATDKEIDWDDDADWDEYGDTPPAPNSYLGLRLAALKSARAVVQDGSDYHAELLTAPDFFCALFAIATEAGTAATVEQGAVHEGAGPQDIAQGPSQ